MYQDISDLSEEEIEEIIDYSDSTDNLIKRYAVACQVIANLTNQLYKDKTSDDEVVDLVICKMLMDGLIEVEEVSLKFH
jgi:hypothetical protein